MNVGRLLPEGFAQAYWDAFHDVPPEEFLESYELLCEVLYYGTRLEDIGKTTGTRPLDYFFAEPRLLGFKGAVDARASALRASLRSWTAQRTSEGEGRPRPADHHRSDLVRDGGPRHSGPLIEEKGA